MQLEIVCHRWSPVVLLLLCGIEVVTVQSTKAQEFSAPAVVPTPPVGSHAHYRFAGLV